MAAGAVVGSLRVDLGINSAQFETGLKKAQSSLDKIGKVAFAAGAAIGAAMGGVAYAVKGALSSIDNLGKTAQKIGVPIEELSKLRHAADMSGVSFEGLTTSLRKLGDNIANAATNPAGEAARAFNAMGISIRNADGSLKGPADILPQLADGFERTRDGANKTALALTLMGKSGADMIPMLNAGAAGLNLMKLEAEQLGLVISEKTFKAAEEFNDNLSRMQKVGTGATTVLAGALAPALKDLSGTMVRLINETSLFEDAGHWLGEALKRTAEYGARLSYTIQRLGEDIRWLGEGARALASLDFAGAVKLGEASEARVQQLQEARDLLLSAIRNPAATTALPFRPPPPRDDAPAIERAAGAARGLNDAQKASNDLMEEGKRLREQMRTPQEQLNDSLQEYDHLLEIGAIDAETWGRAVKKAYEDAEGATKAAGVTLKDIGKQLETSFGSWIDSAIEGTFKLKDALASLAKDMARMFAQKALTMAIGLAIPGFAAGTNFAPGGLSLVGERGPELVNLPRGSQVIPNHDLGGMGGGVNINVNVAGATGNTEVMRMVEAGVSSGLERYDRNLGARMADKTWRRT